MLDENGFRKGLSKVQNRRQAACRFFSCPLLFCQSFRYPSLGLYTIPEYDIVRSSGLSRIVSPHVCPWCETALRIVYEGANSTKHKSDTISHAGRRGWTERWSSVNGDTVKRERVIRGGERRHVPRSSTQLSHQYLQAPLQSEDDQ